MFAFDSIFFKVLATQFLSSAPATSISNAAGACSLDVGAINFTIARQRATGIKRLSTPGSHRGRIGTTRFSTEKSTLK